MKHIKLELYRVCQAYVNRRIQTATQAIEAAQHAANEETKSTAGDKYETGRAMMQLEIEKNSQQLSESLKLKHVLDHIQLENIALSVQPGSLVVTDRDTFFIAISLGQITLQETNFLVLSPGSPLGSKLIGLKPGEGITFKEQTYVVREIF